MNGPESQQHPKSEITPPISWSEPDDFKGRLLRKGDGGPPTSETPCLGQTYLLAPPPNILPQYLPPSPSPAVAPVPFGWNRQPTSSVIRKKVGVVGAKDLTNWHILLRPFTPAVGACDPPHSHTNMDSYSCTTTNTHRPWSATITHTNTHSSRTCSCHTAMWSN